MARDIFIQYCD